MPKSTRNDRGTYEVGYGKPPKATQFRKGQSGNPSGRPSKRPTLADAARKALNSQVGVRDGDKVRRITQFEAVVRRQLEMAMKGDQKAADLVLRLAQLFADGANSRSSDPVDGSELTQDMQNQVLADFLALNGLEPTSDKDDRGEEAS
jgi:hypothetical protein